MLGLLTTILGGWVGLGFCKIKANSAQLELELGLSLAILYNTIIVASMSTGTGNIIVLLFSAEILFSVCRYLS